MAPTPSAAARAVAEKHLQDIYEQELKDYKQKYTYKVTLKIKILERSKSKLFTVGGREDLLKSISTVLIIVGFFLIAVR